MRRGLPLLTLALALLAPATVQATTICVPAFHAACPNSGGNVAVAQIETALRTNGDDGIADRVVIAPGTVSHNDTISLLGSDEDDLEIVGAGPDQTAITSTDNGNQFVVNLNEQRAVTVRDLTVRVPASFPDGQGGGIQAEGAIFENVDIESRNPGSNGASSLIGTNTFSNGHVYGSMGGSIGTAFSGNDASGSGTMTIERTTIDDAVRGVSSDDPGISVYVRQVTIHNPVSAGVEIIEGSFMVVENSVIEANSGTPVVAESTDAGTVIATVRNSTIVGNDLNDDFTAIRSRVFDDVGNGPVNLVVSDTIVAGYSNPLHCEAPSAANVGNASLSITYSYFMHSATVLGDCTLFNQNTLDAFDPQIGPPQFAGPGDYRLPPTSPAIDSGNPATVSLTTIDFLGAPRPVDGDGDGTATRDIGAFEYQPPVPEQPGGGGPTPTGPGGGNGGAGRADDRTAPKLSKLRLRKRPTATRRGRLTVRLSERSRVTVTLQRVRKVKGPKPRAFRQTFTAKAGANSLKLRKRTLRPGRYKLSIVAVDSAGNRSLPVRRTFIVPR